MNIKKAIASGLINKAKLARLMWPDVKSAPTALNNKLNENASSTGKWRMLESDWKRAEEVVKKELEL